jgi:hypothetical protein
MSLPSIPGTVAIALGSMFFWQRHLVLFVEPLLPEPLLLVELFAEPLTGEFLAVEDVPLK